MHFSLGPQQTAGLHGSLRWLSGVGVPGGLLCTTPLLPLNSRAGVPPCFLSHLRGGTHASAAHSPLGPGASNQWLDINQPCPAAHKQAFGPRVLITAYLLLPGSFRLAHHEKSCFSTRGPLMPFVRLCAAVPLWPRFCLEGGSEPLHGGQGFVPALGRPVGL